MASPRAKPDGPGGQPETERREPATQDQADLVRSGRPIDSDGQKLGPFGGAAITVEDGRLGIAGVEGGVVAAVRTPAAPRGRAERAMIQVQWVLARDDRFIVPHPRPGL